MSTGRIIGPAIAGQLLVTAGPGLCFLALSLAYLVPIVVLVTKLHDIPPAQAHPTGGAGGGVRAGLVAAAQDPLVRCTIFCAAVLAFFGGAYIAYLPVFAATSLHGGGAALGMLYSAGGLGGLTAAIVIATRGRQVTQVRMLGTGGLAFAAGLATLTRSHTLAVALPALVVISFGFLAMNTSMSTLLRTDTDPALRGRLLGLYSTTFAGLLPLGTVAYGMAAHFVPLFDAFGVGALLVGAAAVWTATRPAVRRTVRREQLAVKGM